MQRELDLPVEQGSLVGHSDHPTVPGRSTNVTLGMMVSRADLYDSQDTCKILCILMRLNGMKVGKSEPCIPQYKQGQIIRVYVA